MIDLVFLKQTVAERRISGDVDAVRNVLRFHAETVIAVIKSGFAFLAEPVARVQLQRGHIREHFHADPAPLALRFRHFSVDARRLVEDVVDVVTVLARDVLIVAADALADAVRLSEIEGRSLHVAEFAVRNERVVRGSDPVRRNGQEGVQNIARNLPRPD